MEDISEYVILQSDYKLIIKLLKLGLVSRRSIYDLIHIIIENNKDDIVLFLYELLDNHEDILFKRIFNYLMLHPKIVIQSELIYLYDYIKITNKYIIFRNFFLKIIPDIIEYNIKGDILTHQNYEDLNILFLELLYNGYNKIIKYIIKESKLKRHEDIYFYSINSIISYYNKFNKFEAKFLVEYMKIVPLK